MEIRLEQTRVPLRRALGILAVTFAFTGGAGLLAEQCFEKLLTRLLGASTPAAAVVLAVYFLGLSLGAAAYPRIRARWKAPLRLFAALEAGVALWSLLLLAGADISVAAILPLLRLGADRFWLLEAIRFGVACVWILPPTILMGATFPAVVEALERSGLPQPRRAMARFYALNLLGALVASIAGPYWLLPNWGLSGVLALTSLVDAVAGALIFLLAYGLRLRSPRASPSPVSSSDLGQTSRVVLGLAFGSGFLFFSLEVLWTHLVAVTVGCSVYAFAAMLSCVLAGLTIGGTLSTVLFSERRPISAATVGALFLVGSALLVWQHGLWPGVSRNLLDWGGSLRRFSQAETLRTLETAWLLLPSSIVLGMVYPALFRIRELGPGTRAATIARMGAMNSVGCVLGALVTGFGLIPALGSEGTSKLLGGMAWLAGTALILTLLRGRARLVMIIFGGCVLWLWTQATPWDRLHLTWGGNVYFQPYQVSNTDKLVYFHEDTLGGITTVVERPDGFQTLLTNGKFQANDSGEVKAQESFALIPTLYTPTLSNALVIGLGSGYSAHVVHELGFREIDIAELAPGIVEAARERFSRLDEDILKEPSVHLHIEDGRNYLLLTHKIYELVVIEITSVWFAGATSVYSREFYQTVREHLAPDGVLQQWVQLHHLTPAEIGSTLATVREVFQYVELWERGGQGIILASNQPLELHAPGLAAYYAHPLSQSTVSDQSLRELLSSELLSAEDVDGMLSGQTFIVNTDWNRYLEYATPRYAIDRRDLLNLNLRYLSRYHSGGQPALGLDVPDHYREVLTAAPVSP